MCSEAFRMSTHLFSHQVSSFRSPGSLVAESLGAPEPPEHLQHVHRDGGLALSELMLEPRLAEPSQPMGYSESFHVAVLLRDVDYDLWLNGRAIPVELGLAGETCIIDQRQDPRWLLRSPSHFIHFSLPLSALNRTASEIERASISELRSDLPRAWNDPVMRSLAECARAALSGRNPLSGLLLDGLLDSVCAHVIGSYGERTAPLSASLTRLAPWQERRAKELMNSNLDVTLAELARECRVSSAHFGRAFRNATGVSPHRWLISRRIDKAERLLFNPEIQLAEIALSCGFSNQSHFSIAFKAQNGVSPGQWRREHVKGAIASTLVKFSPKNATPAGGLASCRTE